MKLGLDFGTHALRAAIVQSGRVEDVPVPGSGYVLPAALCKDKAGQWLVGDKAQTALTLSPSKGLASFKRLLGVKEPLPFRVHYPYPYVTSPLVTTRVKFGEDRPYRLDELTAEFLGQALAVFAKALGGPITKVVATVPDHYSPTQRAALVRAFTLAKAPLSQLVDDSTTALMGLQNPRLHQRRVLLISLGAGFGTCALASFHNHTPEILASAPFKGISGDDLAYQVAYILADRFKKSRSVAVADTPEVQVRLFDAARQVVEKLSTAAVAKVELPYLADKNRAMHTFSYDMTPGEVQQTWDNARKQVVAVVKAVLSEGRTAAASLAGVAVTGGSSACSFVGAALKELNIPEIKGFVPQTLTAQGAALIAASEDDSNRSPLYEICGSDLHLMLPNKKFVQVFSRNSPRPAKKDFLFHPVKEQWPSHTVALIHGEITDERKPPLLGTYPLSAVTASREEVTELRVLIRVDANGIVTLGTGVQGSRKADLVMSLEEQDDARPVDQDPADLPQGTILDERFKVIRQLGSGGFSFIYLVQNLKTEKREVLKVLRPQFNVDPVVLERFRRSAEQLIPVRHPNIVEVYDFFQWHGLYMIHMAYIDGWDLERFMETDTFIGMRMGAKVKLLMGIAEALIALRDKRILHADLKPSNIMIGLDNVARLIDFELSNFLDLKPLANEAVTGTPKYFSPEHLANKDAFGEHSDIFSLGLIGYTMLVGSFPKKEHKPEADYIFSILELGKTVKPIHPSKVNRKVPQGLGDVLVKAIDTHRTERYQRYEDLIDALLPYQTA